MRRGLLATICLVLMMSLAACGNSVSNDIVSQLKETKAPEKATMQNVLGRPIEEAIQILTKAGVKNIQSNSSEYEGYNIDRIIVTAQNIDAGEEIDPNQEVELTCSYKCQLYVDVESATNLFFNKYDIDIYLDDTALGTVSNGEIFTNKMELMEGSYTLYFYQADKHENMVEYAIDLCKDTTFRAFIEHDHGVINLESAMLLDSVSGSELVMPDVRGSVLTTAKDNLTQQGFVNISTKDGTVLDNTWVVIGQSPEAGTVMDKNDSIVLECEKIGTYILSKIYHKNFLDAHNLISEELGMQYTAEDYYTGESLYDQLNGKTQEDWMCWRVEDVSYTPGAFVVELSYVGSPRDWAMLEQLENDFPTYMAREAIRVAFMNMNAKDVFDATGRNYDISKFHDFKYQGEYKMTVKNDGYYSYKDRNSWHAQEVYLLMESEDLAIKVTCDISYDKEKFTLSNVRYLTAKAANIDSKDTYKTSGWMDLKPTANTPFLELPASMVR